MLHTHIHEAITIYDFCVERKSLIRFRMIRNDSKNHLIRIPNDKAGSNRRGFELEGVAFHFSDPLGVVSGVHYRVYYMGAYLGKGPYWQLITLCWLYFGVMFQI